jgi:hypothetical protein
VKGFLHVTLSPFGAVQGITELAPAVVEIQIKQRGGADDLIIAATSYAPLQSHLPLKALMDFIDQLFGCVSICERWRAPITHHLRMRKYPVEGIDVVFSDPS